MSERPPDYVDLDEDEDFDEPQAPESAVATAQDDPADPENGDDVIGRAAAVLKYIVERIVDEPNQISSARRRTIEVRCCCSAWPKTTEGKSSAVKGGSCRRSAPSSRRRPSVTARVNVEIVD